MKPKKTTKKNSAPISDVALGLDPDAWPRFEALVKSAAKMGHKPHKPEDARNKPKRSGPR